MSMHLSAFPSPEGATILSMHLSAFSSPEGATLFWPKQGQSVYFMRLAFDPKARGESR
jgi:hypothetical protein